MLKPIRNVLRRIHADPNSKNAGRNNCIESVRRWSFVGTGGPRRAARLAPAVLALGVLAACNSRPVLNVDHAALRTLDDNKITMAQVEEAIIKAGRSRRWTVERVAPGELEARINVRKHFASVRITHDTKSYSITYKDSRNLKYNGTSIERNYNRWINNLSRAIQRQAMILRPGSQLQAKETPPMTRAPEPRVVDGSPDVGERNRVTGTGFVVSTDGHILTNRHVVAGCQTVHASKGSNIERTGVRVDPKTRVWASNKSKGVLGAGELRVVDTDSENDLALLQTKDALLTVAKFRGGGGIRLGDDVIVAGFPLAEYIGSDLNVTKGSVSSLAGPRNSNNLIQITAPVQPGNSGGPVLDQSGNVVGVVAGRLDSLKLARLTGKLPQNVNFAISEGISRAFLDANGVRYEIETAKPELAPAEVAARARDFTVLVECWK